MQTGFLFPGQGAQYPGMGKDFWETNDEVKELFDLASRSTDIDMKKLLFEGTEEELKVTDKTQVAITLVNLAASILINKKGIKADACAGFSLGEYAALVEAGVISLDDIFPIVKARGELMEKASRHQDSPDGNPGMAAVIGLPFEKIEDIVKNSGIEGIFIANYNSPTQIVLSGTAAGLKQAEPACKEAGARRYIMLKVSGPFHCPLLDEAREGMAEVLKSYSFSDPKITVYSNVTGKKISSGEEAKGLLLDQIVSTVLWVDIEQALLAQGIEQCYEVGPGTVLSGLWKSVNKEVPCKPAGKLESIESFE